jgi:hypothetical protein
MKLLRDFVFLGRLRSLAAARRTAEHRAYTVTVPAPLAAGAGNVVALRRPSSDGAGRRVGARAASLTSPRLARAAHQ